MSDIAVLGLRIDPTGALKGIETVEGKLLTLEQAFGKVQKAAGVAFGAALAAGIGLTIKNTIEAERSFKLLENRVRSTGGGAGFAATELAKMAGELQKVSTFGDEAIMDMQALLLTFTQVKGDTFVQAQTAVMNLATAMGTDLKAASLQVGKALNDPVKGASALAEAGIQFTDAQKAMIATMVEANDIAGAQAVILKELEVQFGGTAAAARDTLGGALMGLKNAFGDLFEAKGPLDGITASINTLTDNLDIAARAAVVLGATMATALYSGSVISGIATTVAAIKTLGATVGIATVATKGLSAVLATIGGPWVIALTATVAALGTAWAIYSKRAKDAAAATDEAKAALDALKRDHGDATAGAMAALFGPKTTTTTTAPPAPVKAITEGLREAEEKAAELAYQLESLPIRMKAIEPVEIFAPVLQQALTTGQPMTVSVLPSERTYTAWDGFKSFMSGLWEEISANLGDVLLSTFNRIAQRGKATLGDLFSGLQGLGVGDRIGTALGIGGKVGGQIFGAAAIVVDMFTAARERLKAAYKLVDDQMDALADSLEDFTRSFGPAVGAFQREMQRIADYVSDTTESIDDILTKTARRALNEAGGDPVVALAELQRRQADPANRINYGPAIAQLEAYIQATIDLTIAQREATAAAIEAQRVLFESAKEELEVRRLVALGRTEEADALRRQIQMQKDIAEAYREFGVKLGAIIEQMIIDVNKLEQDAIDAAKAQDRARTIGGLDVQIARAKGDEEEAKRIEREMILLGVTDELIRAKYEELWAIEDATAAAQEAADAMALLERQTMRSEDLEVRRLMATGKAIEAEIRRFELEQARELREAQKLLEQGEITQEFFDQLIEVLGLEAAAFNDEIAARNAGATGAGGAASGVSGSTQTGSIQALATAQVQDIDRVVGELTTIRIRVGQQVQLLQAIFRGGGIVGAVNAGLQADTSQESLFSGNVVVS
jgi:hypothetical protein